jgi:hypothetical protein
MSTMARRIDGREIYRALQGTKFRAEATKVKDKVRDSLVLILDEGREPLSIMGNMRRKIFDEAVSTLLQMKTSPTYFAEMTGATGPRPPDVTVANLQEMIRIAPPSAIDETANRIADDVLEDAFREAETITGKL